MCQCVHNYFVTWSVKINDSIIIYYYIIILILHLSVSEPVSDVSPGVVSQATPFNPPEKEGLVKSRTTSCSATGSCRVQSDALF